MSAPVRGAPSQPGAGTVWFTGLPAAGKSTVAAALTELLETRQIEPLLLDGDELREGLNADLGFSPEDRRENVRRIGERAVLFSQAGHLCLVTAISPFRAGRDAARGRHVERGVGFFEVHVATPLEVCEARDPKGLYARARRGELAAFTGISSPYEAPAHPDLALETVGRTPVECAAEVLAALDGCGLTVRD